MHQAAPLGIRLDQLDQLMARGWTKPVPRKRPVHFRISARIVTPPTTGPAGTAPRDLSASIFYGYDLGRGINVCLRYVFTAPAGRACMP